MEKNGNSTTMIPLLQNFSTVVLADGDFPKNELPLGFLRNASQIICCDGATQNLLDFGLEPDYIVGDMDSISENLKKRFAQVLRRFSEQETNDQTKSVRFCVENGWKQITILGATGKREDHTLGNLSLITDYAEIANIQLLTDYGVFVPQLKSEIFESYPGQQVSIFSLDSETLVTTDDLVYPIKNRPLNSWWQGTLNEATANSFKVEIDKGKLLIFRKYK
jgi:thiamine pyrophosphokinase